MTQFKNLLIAAVAAAAMTACTPPATNAPANTSNMNANAAKPAPAAPTKEALFDMDKKANEAYTKGDSKFFEDMLSDKFVMYPGGQRVTKADAVKMIATVKCDIKSMTFDDPQMATIDADTYVISYKTTTDGTCKDPKTNKDVKVPSPVRAASVFVRNGDKWLGVFHGENEIAEASKPAADDKNAAPKKEETKKPVAQMEEPKKDEGRNPMSAKMASTSTASNATASNASDSSAPAKAVPDANTDALSKIHNEGWEAWKNKDSAKLESLTASNLSTVDPAGSWHSGKADVIKFWTTMDCKNITKASFKDGVATALSPTVEILTGVGTADGMCDGHKNGDVDNVAFYVKEGSDWKMAFFFESPHGKM